METRRAFLKAGAAVCIAAAVPEASSMGKPGPGLPFPPRQPEKALVVWFSQTGHTGKIGNSIAKVWEAEGLKVD
ncbi:MAG: flavodoxin family protein, partial [Desulfobacterales bacterium]|nr:flavodoxin family protein [Desulfobacterales bacterium]